MYAIRSYYVAGATLIGSNHLLVNSYYDRASELEFVADGGLEWTRPLGRGRNNFV